MADAKQANPFRLARKRCGLSQVEAAEALGIKQTTISRIETGRAEPKLSTAVRMADVYETTLEILVGRAAPPD